MRRCVGSALIALSVGFAWPLSADEAPDAIESEQASSSAAEVGDQLWQLDQQVKRNPRAIQPHKRNYFTFSYFDSDYEGLDADSSPFDNGLDHAEIKFQISIRVPVMENVLGSQADLYVAYTSKAFWQALNSEASSPFKDINHEPELFMLWPTHWSFGPISSRAVTLGFNHHSNGQLNRELADDSGTVIYESASRSWNRIMLGAYFEQKNFLWHLQTWYRIPEEEKDDPLQATGDDNPDIEDYMGNFELTVQHRISDRYTSTLILRNNLDREDNYGAVRWDMTFPLTRKLDGIVQLFHGYGESLLDYNSLNSRVAVGFTLRGL